MAEPRRLRIAVINDDSAFLELMEELLEREEGYQVLVCKQWQGAYQFVKDQRPDLVILDIVLGPGEEQGWTILNLLTLDPDTRPIPLLVCSAAIRSLEAHQEQLSRYKIRALPKPFDLEALLGSVTALLDEREERGGSEHNG